MKYGTDFQVFELPDFKCECNETIQLLNLNRRKCRITQKSDTQFFYSELSLKWTLGTKFIARFIEVSALERDFFIEKQMQTTCTDKIHRPA